MRLGGGELLLQSGLRGFGFMLFTEGFVHIGHQEIEQKDQQGGDEPHHIPGGRGKGREVQVDGGKHIDVVGRGNKGEQQEKLIVTINEQIVEAAAEHILCKQKHYRVGDQIGQ